VTVHPRSRGPVLAVLCGLLALAGCAGQPVSVPSTPPLVTIGLPTPSAALPTGTAPASGEPATSASPTAIPTPTSLPTPTPLPATATPATPTLEPTPSAQAAGSPSAHCVDGWVSPPPDSSTYQEGVAILDGAMGVEGPWQLAEMRYFTGPDVPWIDPGYPVVERWYIKASLVDDPGYRARWLIEKRTDTIEGVSAVAPYDSLGYRSPDWTGFEGEGPPTTYVGLPGEWSGIAFDFVTGAGDSGQPGLPDQVVGCLKST
jgi:hypothetical protein